MLELGNTSIKLHQSLMNVIIKNRIDEVYTIGSKMKYLSTSLKKAAANATHFTNRKSLLNFIRNMNFTDSVILVKGSRGMHMEDFVSVIKKKTMN
jgi:UDP-N-acetylmuramoyl-tripeptide--D-alanyl-D-alanine ligase